MQLSLQVLRESFQLRRADGLAELQANFNGNDFLIAQTTRGIEEGAE